MKLKPLPETWQLEAHARAGLVEYVLIDGAMQPEWIARARESDRTRVLALLPTEDDAARALGPWLLSASTAHSIGLTGVDCGINWIASPADMHGLHAHLARWVTFRQPDSERPFYLRLADGRTLTAISHLWTTRQYADFCRPLAGWCYADRDGNAARLPLSQSGHNLPHPATTRLSAEQYERLLEASVPDMLLHALPEETSSQFDGRREDTHRIAVQMLDRLQNLGYEDAGEQLEVLNAMLCHACFHLEDDRLERTLKGAPHGDALIRVLHDLPAERNHDSQPRVAH